VQLEREHAIEKERRRIAQDMHDELGSRLAKLSFLSELAKDPSDASPERARRIDAIADTSRAVLATLDEIVWAVNPQNDTLEHLAAYLAEYARQFFQMTPIECAVQMPVSLPSVSLAAETRHHLFLSVQEALGNVMKHAHATRVRVTMALGERHFSIAIEDNGSGFAMPTSAGTNGSSPAVGPVGRNGLANMRRRLDAIGARFSVISQVAGGTVVTFTLPLPSERIGETRPEGTR
jgi:signal transduction histidine kinase